MGTSPGMTSSKEMRVEGGRRWMALARVGCGSTHTLRIHPGMGTREVHSKTMSLYLHLPLD